jgi:hypothetical protein
MRCEIVLERLSRTLLVTACKRDWLPCTLYIYVDRHNKGIHSDAVYCLRLLGTCNAHHVQER